jgi:hypothetical protein
MAKKEPGLAVAILDAEAEKEGQEPEESDTSDQDMALDEVWAAIKGDDKESFKTSLKAAIDLMSGMSEM